MKSPFLRSAGLGLVCGVAIALSGCATAPFDFVGNTSRGYAGDNIDGEGGMTNASIAQPVPPERALAQLPPDAGRVVQVIEQRYTNGISQRIVLAGDPSTHGENRIEIQLETEHRNQRDYDNLITMKRPDDTDIEAEMKERFRGVAMDVKDVLLENSYGPYGLAVGHSGSTQTCIYAWQWIDDLRGSGGRGFRSMFQAVKPVSIRVRLCRSGFELEDMIAFVKQLIVASPARNGLPFLSTQRTLKQNGVFQGNTMRRAEDPGFSVQGMLEGDDSKRAPLWATEQPEARPVQVARKPVSTRLARRSVAVPAIASDNPNTQPQYALPAYGTPVFPAYPPVGGQPAQSNMGYGMQQPGYSAPEQSAVPLDSSLPARAYKGPGASPGDVTRSVRPPAIKPYAAPMVQGNDPQAYDGSYAQPARRYSAY